MIPLPADPFALPYTLKSDPLRGPVFVPLNLECLMKEGNNCLFHGKFLIIITNTLNLFLIIEIMSIKNNLYFYL